MAEHQTLYLLALSMIKNLGPVRIRNLIAHCGSAYDVFQKSEGRLQNVPGIGHNHISQIRQADTLRRAEEEIQYCRKEGIHLITYLHAAYPRSLHYIHHAPLIIFIKGQIDFNAQAAIAIVGTRNCTERGRAYAFELGSFFGAKGINVVSGLAYGIDIAAHKGALAVEGKTTACLGHSLEYIYPAKHRSAVAKIIRKGGLLSEFPSGNKPEAMNFPARNRIISGLCEAVIVVEAASKGGALITARFAFEQNKEVYAVPGRLSDPYSRGCNTLIQQQCAQLLTDPQEVIDALEIQWQNQLISPSTPQLELEFTQNLSSEENKILGILKNGEALMDQIIQKTGIPSSKLNPLLLAMEFKGLVKQIPGKKFILS